MPWRPRAFFALWRLFFLLEAFFLLGRPARFLLWEACTFCIVVVEVLRVLFIAAEALHGFSCEGLTRFFCEAGRASLLWRPGALFVCCGNWALCWL